MALPSSLLCPVDFSEHAERALRHAVALAGAFNARLTVVNVNDPVLVEGAAAAGHADTWRNQVEAALLALLERVPAHTARIVPAIDIVLGAAAPEILKASERAQADLVVMGSQGLGGTSKLVFGSTAERVIRTSKVPVLVVPAYSPEQITVTNGASRFGLGAVVAALGRDQLDAEVAGVAAEWAAAAHAPLVLAHVCADAPAPVWWPFDAAPATADACAAARADVAAIAAALPGGATATVDVRRGLVPAAVAEITRDRNAGLLVVSRGGGGHRVGAMAYRIMCEADLPTLVVAGR